MVVSAWSNHVGARSSSEILVRGQSDLLLRGIKSEVRSLVQTSSGPPNDQHASEILALYRENGLRYLGIRTRQFSEAGVSQSAAPDPPPPPGGGVEFFRLSDDRVRVIDHAPGQPARGHGPRRPGPGFRDGRPPGQPGPGGSPHDRLGPGGSPHDRLGPDQARGRPRRGRPPPPTIIIEFEPVRAQELMGRARRSLWISAITALFLAIAAVIAFRWLQKREVSDRKLENERHLATLGQMSAVLAHEIRNPLAALKGHAQLLAESLPEGKPRTKAERVVREAIRLEDLTNGLLAFVRTGVIERRAIDPLAPLRAAIAETKPDRITLDADSAPETWKLDRGRMQQVLSNLLRNAFQASPDDANVVARVTRTRDGLVYEIRDHGKGIEPGQERAIFEAFHTKRTHGTGLGLAVAKRVVQLHGGTIHAKNHPEGGALFRIVLPDFG